MQAEKEQSWKIYIHAKAKNFHFKLRLKATNIVPTWEFHQCSIVLKLGKYQKQPKTLKSKFLVLLKKFRIRRSKNRAFGFKQKSDLSKPEENRIGWFAYKVQIQYMDFFQQLGIINVLLFAVGKIPLFHLPLFPCIAQKERKKCFTF